VEICFDPMVIRVDPGQRVTWTNRESIAHTVTGPAGLWGSVGQLADGESVSQVFDIPGIYPYACLLHPGMIGAVVVGNGGAPGGPVTAARGAELAQIPVSPAAAPHAAAVRGPHRSPAWPAAAAIIGLVSGAAAYAIARTRVAVPKHSES